MEHLKPNLKVDCAQLSHSGIKPVNEDSIGIRIPEGSLLTHKGIVAVIADGVSAAEAGREASQACVQNFLYDYYCTPETWTVQKSVLAVLNALNSWLFSQGRHLHDASRGYVTTLSILVLKSSTAHIFHIGDSRICRLRAGELEQLTTDHVRVVAETSYLARAMGLDSKIQVDYRQVSLQAGDSFILTTDGVHDFYTQDKWQAEIENNPDLDYLVKSICNKALQAGSHDNVSCQIVSVEQLAESTREEVYQHLAGLPFPPFLSAGDTIDGLKVMGTLYESRRSQLYLVQNIETGERYVMKTPSVNFEDDLAYIERFAMQSWLGRRLRNSKLVRVVKPKTEPTYLYFLMEYVEGITLEQWLKQTSQPSLDTVVRIARQIAAGLRALHRQQVIHKDLKPGNIIIDANEQIKLIDYDSCEFMSMKELATPFEREIALGTVQYSSPEAVLAKPVTESADIFSLAAIIYEMLTGRLPYSEKLEEIRSEADLQKMHYRSALNYNRYVPRWFDLALEKALSLDAADRYSDVDEFLHDIEKPNATLLVKESAPLAVRKPVQFWQSVAVIQLVVIILLLASLI